MAKVSSPIVPDDFRLDLGFVSVPAHAIRDLAPMDGVEGATGSGLILSDAAIKFRLMRDGGAPVEYSVAVTAKRLTPLDDAEKARIKVAKSLADARKADREAKIEATRQGLIERTRDESARDMTRGMDAAAKFIPHLQTLQKISDVLK